MTISAGRKLKIAEIRVGTRIREDMGNIEELAQSLSNWGLIHPIVVDEELNLIAGHRRLEAAKLLGWEEIEVRFAGELSEREKRLLELEENIRRKDLTEYERSQKIVEFIEIAKEQAIQESFLLRSTVDRPKNNYKDVVGKNILVPGSKNDISARIGISKTTLIRAEQHVRAVEKYPDLAEKGKIEAIRIAKQRGLQGKDESESSLCDNLTLLESSEGNPETPKTHAHEDKKKARGLSVAWSKQEKPQKVTKKMVKETIDDIVAHLSRFEAAVAKYLHRREVFEAFTPHQAHLLIFEIAWLDHWVGKIIEYLPEIEPHILFKRRRGIPDEYLKHLQ